MKFNQPVSQALSQPQSGWVSMFQSSRQFPNFAHLACEESIKNYATLFSTLSSVWRMSSENICTVSITKNC